ncbi:hypothetical protein PRIPAC_74590 [Pristionchus pacificus]|uniref:Uncharacterized protein n=1 Tax=Pristionchus pacificus TaxID=54126 RepID=A0A2A6B5D2_PRIPA|nr:hypothetical protein PRIPAC_74590 [Pristionchus pacificus]|eukprot:PDM61084.1 hypothetical protein PRIPAC_54890 [Pristionchus pacificus]
MLDYGADCEEALDRMLDLGFLEIAKYYTSAVYGTGYNSVIANIFRPILQKRPEWTQTFKRWTENGEIGSETARIGREIPERVAKPGQMYMWEEDFYLEF